MFRNKLLLQAAGAQALQGPPGISLHSSELSYAEGRKQGHCSSIVHPSLIEGCFLKMLTSLHFHLTLWGGPVCSKSQNKSHRYPRKLASACGGESLRKGAKGNGSTCFRGLPQTRTQVFWLLAKALPTDYWTSSFLVPKTVLCNPEKREWEYRRSRGCSPCLRNSLSGGPHTHSCLKEEEKIV